jgi:glycosyltransferase involved in cell wall biosynthesis
MKILMLTPYLPYPLHSGGQIRSYNLLKNLSKKHQITLFSFIRSDEEKKQIKHLQKYCAKVAVFKRRRPWDPRNVLLAAFTPYPFLVAIYLSKTVRQAIAQELEKGKYDLIHAETFYVMPNLPKLTQIPTLLVEQTIEYLVYQRFVTDFKFWPLKPLLYFDVFKIKLWEKYFWREAASLAAMSDADKQMMQRQTNRSKVEVVANGVDIGFFAKVKKTIKSLEVPVVLFVGNFKWLPNRDAASFLTLKIWPLILKKIPRAKLWIVGRNPTREINNLANNRQVTVNGNVSDIRTAFSQAQVLLAPIRNGRGTKYKVLEAMASNTPVVTTRLGIEGIEALDKKAVLLAESPQGLAEKTTAILTDKNLSHRLAVNAKKLVVNKYSWEAISQKLDTIYQRLGGA